MDHLMLKVINISRREWMDKQDARPASCSCGRGVVAFTICYVIGESWSDHSSKEVTNIIY